METPNSAARERVLQLAEQLFQERGYAAVSMSDLANALGIQKASLYHHAANGKEALYVEVMERLLDRYQAGLTEAVAAADTFYGQLQQVARWLLEHPSLAYERMMQADMPQISPESAAHLSQKVFTALLRPLEAVFKPEMRARGLDASKATYLAGAFLSMIEGIHYLPYTYVPVSKTEMADFLIEILFTSFGLSGPTSL